MCPPKPPKMSTPPERQAMKLPDEGVDLTKSNGKRRRAVMAGIITSPQGALGSPTAARPTLG
jgi:hypothetical protein